MSTHKGYDTLRVGRFFTQDGYLIAVKSSLARTGIQEYRAYELGMTDADPLKIIRLMRTEEEVFDAASVKSFENVPLTIEHPSELITAANWPTYAKGEVRDVARDGQFLTGTVIVKSQEAIDAIQSGKSQLSNGYIFDLDMTPGAGFDGHQRNIRGNHVAIVDAARCGVACKLTDSLPTKEVIAVDKKMTVLGIAIEVNDTAASVIEKLEQQWKDMSVVSDGLVKKAEAVSAEHVAAIAAKDAEIVTLKAAVPTAVALDAMVAERVKLLDAAKRLAPKVVTDGRSCDMIARDIVASVMTGDSTGKAVADAVLAGKELASADIVLVRSAVAAIDAATVKVNDDAGNETLADALAGGKKEEGKKLVGRDAMIDRQSKAWQAK